MPLAQRQKKDAINKYSERFTIEELENKYPFLNWKKYLGTLFSFEIDSLRPDHGKLFNGDRKFKLRLLCPRYFDALQKLISNTDQYLLMDIIRWERMDSYFSNSLFDKALQINIVSNKKAKKLSKEDLCVKITDETFGFAIGKLFTSSNFSKIRRKNVDLLTENIRHSFEKILSESSWLDKNSMDMALEKVRNITEQTDVPSFVWNERQLNRFYKSLEPSVGFIRTFLQYRR